MDSILYFCETNIFQPFLYPSYFTHRVSESSIGRQLLGLLIVFTLGGYLLYLTSAGFSYYFIFDKRLKTHPLFLPNQIRREIGVSCRSLIWMSFLTVPCFLLEVRGYSRLHAEFQGVGSLLLSTGSFILFTDCLIYWIHRGLHSPWAYKRLHKVHHLWKIPTPFASHAFHPLDGFLQSIPYHLYVFTFPMNKWIYMIMFTFVNFWTVSIHDGNFSVPKLLKPIINGAAHHTDHHLFYNYNYGQFFTLWDRVGGSFREPSAFEPDSQLQQFLNPREDDNYVDNRAQAKNKDR